MPVIIRLRRFLKAALRSYGLRCVAIEPALAAELGVSKRESVAAERDENTCREAYTGEEAVRLGKRIEKAYKPQHEKETHERKGLEERRRARGVAANSSGGNFPIAKRDESARNTGRGRRR